MKKESPIDGVSDICGRVRQVRRELHGNRGKVRFAKQLGLSASTYNYYEHGRTPPADVLVKIAEASGVDLRWLLTGQESSSVPADYPAIGRIARLLADHPDAAGPLTAFVDILAASLAWPAKSVPAGDGRAPDVAPVSLDVGSSAAAVAADHIPSDQAHQAAEDDAAGREASRQADWTARTAARHDLQASSAGRDWIPILGRSAAGVPQFWDDQDDAAGVTLLSELVDRCAGRPGRRVRSAAAGEEGQPLDSVGQIITLAAPDRDNVAEFVAAGDLKERYPDAFAVRIDGDSMSPEICHGDVVICSASAPACDGSAAIVQIAGQIGVTCKVFRRSEGTVHLVPINEQYHPQSFPAGKIVWTRRVLARLRPA